MGLTSRPSRSIAALALGLLVSCGEAKPARECEPVSRYRGILRTPIELGLEQAKIAAPELAPLPAATSERLDAALLAAQRDDAIEAVSAAILTDDGQYWSSGSQRFWWGSIGKSFTAMLVLELQTRGKLELSTPVAPFVPELPGLDGVTVDQLLTHTSGLSNYVGSAEHRQIQWRYTPPDELVAKAIDARPIQCVGGQWRYSSIGYLVLGLVIEAVEQRPYHELMNELLVARLGPTSLQAVGPGAPPDDVILPAGEPPASITTPFAAGGIVGSALDMAVAWKQFLSGSIVPESDVELMFAALHERDKPGQLYGRGVAVYVLPSGELLLAHNGAIDGARAHVSWSWRHRAVVAVALTGKGSPQHIAAALLPEL